MLLLNESKFFFWFERERESFNLCHPLLMIFPFIIRPRHQSVLGQGLNPRSLIQQLETLPIELTGTHQMSKSYSRTLIL